MPWTYNQTTGELSQDGRHIATGYSGMGIHKNSPESQSIPNEGPIPTGTYTIGPATTTVYERKAPPVFHLIPDPSDNMYGRSGMLVHGDNIDHTASQGCIILDHNTRVLMANSTDRRLQVISGLT